MEKYYCFKFICFFVFIGFTSCSQDDAVMQNPVSTVIPIVTNEEAINPYRTLPGFAFTIPADYIQHLPASRSRAYLREAKYDVSCHRFTYTMIYKEQEITASGLIAIPLDCDNPPLLSFHHGTLTSKATAPSLADYNTFLGFQCLPGIVSAAHGYLTVIPDYVGYGASSSYLHPYLIYEPTATAVIEMIKAVKLFLSEHDIAFDDKLFLAGYSEGGYVTLAVQKEIETNPGHGLTVTASAPGGGTYNLRYGFELVLERTHYSSPSLLGFALLAYNDFYLNRPVTDLFQEPYASRMSDLFGNNLSIEEANSQLSSSIESLLAPAFLTSIQSEDDTLNKLLDANSVDDWTPRRPTRMWHGTSDNIVYYANAVQAYDRFIENGADPNTVQLIQAAGVEHEGSLWLADTFEWLNTF